MFEQQPERITKADDSLHPSIYVISGVTMGGLVSLLLWIGIFPDMLMVIIKDLLAVR
jgi:hypothetical protein